MPETSRAGRSVLLGALASTTALILTACSWISPSGPELRFAPGGHWTADSMTVAEHHDWLVGDIPVCLDKPGSVTVTDIRAGGGDVIVTGFASQHFPPPPGKDLIGSSTDTLVQAGLTPGPVTVTQVCDPDKGTIAQLIVQVHNNGTTTTKSKTLIVTYEAGGKTRSLEIPHGIVLCVKPTDNPECKAPDPPQ